LKAGSVPTPSSPEELRKRYEDWIAIFGKIAKDAGISRTKCFDHDQAVRRRSVSLEQGNTRDCAYRHIMGLTRLSPMRSAPQGTSHTRVCGEA